MDISGGNVGNLTKKIKYFSYIYFLMRFVELREG